METRELEAAIETIKGFYDSYFAYTGSRILGCPDTLEKLFLAFLSGGNVLLEGAPGLGKTSLVKAYAGFFGLEFRRVQFTPDLMPLDIIGSNILEDDERGRRSFRFYKGPIFANVVLGDEINRATPKTQSAFLEAMEEKHVTFLGEVHSLPDPFFVIATQNPIELEGTYPLPEAQIDRFFMKLHFRMPDLASLKAIMDLEPGSGLGVSYGKEATCEALATWRALSRELVTPGELKSYIARLVEETHPDRSSVEVVKRSVLYGASPRSAISLYNAAKAKAVISGRVNVSKEDAEEVLFDVVGHRLTLGFDAVAEGITVASVLNAVRNAVNRDFDRGIA